MTIWIDAQLSPFIANLVAANFPDIDAVALHTIGLQDASDYDVFRKARKAKVVVMSKDYDLVKLIDLHGVPPS